MKWYINFVDIIIIHYTGIDELFNCWNMVFLNIADSGSSNGEQEDGIEVKVYVGTSLREHNHNWVAQNYVLVNTYCNW